MEPFQVQSQAHMSSLVVFSEWDLVHPFRGSVPRGLLFLILTLPSPSPWSDLAGKTIVPAGSVLSSAPSDDLPLRTPQNPPSTNFGPYPPWMRTNPKDRLEMRGILCASRHKQALLRDDWIADRFVRIRGSQRIERAGREGLRSPRARRGGLPRRVGRGSTRQSWSSSHETTHAWKRRDQCKRCVRGRDSWQRRSEARRRRRAPRKDAEGARCTAREESTCRRPTPNDTGAIERAT